VRNWQVGSIKVVWVYRSRDTLSVSGRCGMRIRPAW